MELWAGAPCEGCTRWVVFALLLLHMLTLSFWGGMMSDQAAQTDSLCNGEEDWGNAAVRAGDAARTAQGSTPLCCDPHSFLFSFFLSRAPQQKSASGLVPALQDSGSPGIPHSPPDMKGMCRQVSHCWLTPRFFLAPVFVWHTKIRCFAGSFSDPTEAKPKQEELAGKY